MKNVLLQLGLPVVKAAQPFAWLYVVSSYL